MLEKSWINAYYPKEYICIETMNKDDFLGRFKYELTYLNAPESLVEKLLIRLNHIETIQVQKRHVYDYIFGHSDSHYFMFEWGI